MPTPFHHFQLLYPPHPAITWKPEEIHQLRDFVAQFKYDDWRVLIYFFPDGKIRFYNRKKQPLSRYRPPAMLLRSLRELNLPLGRFHVLDGGLIHYKTPRIKNTIVLWDILVYSDSYLSGTTYLDRYRILKEISHSPKTKVILDGISIALQIASFLWLAPLLRGDLKTLYKKASRLPEIEGLILKKINSPLRRAYSPENNANWLIRARKPRIDYLF